MPGSRSEVGRSLGTRVLKIPQVIDVQPRPRKTALEWSKGFLGGLGGKEPACNTVDTGDAGSTPGLGRSFGGRLGNPLQYSRLENSVDRGAWWATVQGVAKCQARLKRPSTQSD